MAAEVEAIEKEVPELEAKKIELESRVEKEESALDAMMESLKGEMAKIGAELDAAQRELQPWEGKIADAKARPRPSFTRAYRMYVAQPASTHLRCSRSRHLFY